MARRYRWTSSWLVALATLDSASDYVVGSSRTPSHAGVPWWTGDFSMHENNLHQKYGENCTRGSVFAVCCIVYGGSNACRLEVVLIVHISYISPFYIFQDQKISILYSYFLQTYSWHLSTNMCISSKASKAYDPITLVTVWKKNNYKTTNKQQYAQGATHPEPNAEFILNTFLPLSAVQTRSKALWLHLVNLVEGVCICNAHLAHCSGGCTTIRSSTKVARTQYPVLARVAARWSVQWWQDEVYSSSDHCSLKTF